MNAIVTVVGEDKVGIIAAVCALLAENNARILSRGSFDAVITGCATCGSALSKEYGEVLGMHIIGPRATDLICEGALAIGSELTLDELAATIHSHPTVTETMRECALDALGRAVHIPPRRK